MDGGEAVQKKHKEEDLDSELENVDGVAELRKRTEAKTSPYGKTKICSDVGWTISAIHFNVMHDSAMKKSIYYFLLLKIYSIVYKKERSTSALNKLPFKFTKPPNCFFSFA